MNTSHMPIIIFKLYCYNTKIPDRTGSNPRGFGKTLKCIKNSNEIINLTLTLSEPTILVCMERFVNQL